MNDEDIYKRYEKKKTNIPRILEYEDFQNHEEIKKKYKKKNNKREKNVCAKLS
jgi:hypothetical protein